MLIGEAQRFIPRTRAFAASWLFIMNSARRNGGEPNAGRHLRHWFREAGFVEARVTTSTVSYSEPAATREWADTYADRTLHSNIAEKSVEYGIATRSELEAIAASWRAWGQDPDALWCFTHTEIVAWKR
jgi:hypothetical protein